STLHRPPPTSTLFPYTTLFRPDNVIAGLQNAARYVVYPGIHFPAGSNEFIVKKETWDALPDDLKEIVMTAAKLAVFESYLKSGKDRKSTRLNSSHVKIS